MREASGPPWRDRRLVDGCGRLSYQERPGGCALRRAVAAEAADDAEAIC